MDSDEHEGLEAPSPTAQAGWFTTTHWSVVLLTAQPDSPRGRKALEELCRTYWLPLYSYVRREGYGAHDAQDLTQGFFVRLLRMDSFAEVSREKGKFRTFLLASLNHFLSDERDHARAVKRGGGQTVIAIDESEAEARLQQVAGADLSPEKAFDHRWALTLLEATLGRVRREYAASGRGELFECLSRFLSSEAAPGDYDGVAEALSMSSSAVAVAVHRLRQRYRECVRLELAQTVASPADLDEEMNYLFSVLDR